MERKWVRKESDVGGRGWGVTRLVVKEVARVMRATREGVDSGARKHNEGVGAGAAAG